MSDILRTTFRFEQVTIVKQKDGQLNVVNICAFLGDAECSMSFNFNRVDLTSQIGLV